MEMFDVITRGRKAQVSIQDSLLNTVHTSAIWSGPQVLRFLFCAHTLPLPYLWGGTFNAHTPMRIC